MKSKGMIRLVLLILAFWGAKRAFWDGRPRKMLKDKKRTALPPAPEPAGRHAEATLSGGQLVANPEAFELDEKRARTALIDVIAESGASLRTSIDVAQHIAEKLWPGTHLHPSGLAAVRSFLRRELAFAEGPDTEDAHEACLVLECHGPHMVEGVLDKNPAADMHGWAKALCAAVFPSHDWTGAGGPPWRAGALDRASEMVSAYQSGRALGT